MIVINKDYYYKRDNGANTAIFAWGLEEPQAPSSSLSGNCFL